MVFAGAPFLTNPATLVSCAAATTAASLTALKMTTVVFTSVFTTSNPGQVSECRVVLLRGQTRHRHRLTRALGGEDHGRHRHEPSRPFPGGIRSDAAGCEFATGPWGGRHRATHRGGGPPSGSTFAWLASLRGSLGRERVQPRIDRGPWREPAGRFDHGDRRSVV